MRVLITVFLLACVIPGELNAAHFRDGGFLADRGFLESIRIEPGLPETGQGFSVRLTGSWPEARSRNALDGEEYPCYGDPEVERVNVVAGNRVVLITNLQHDPSICGQPPVPWDFEVAIPGSAWDAVDETGHLRIEHQLFSGINMFTHVNQVFDLRFGSHEIPAYLGSGVWISPELPFEGLLLEQQGSRVLFYSLGYDREAGKGDDGEPVWQMVVGEMYGNSTLGRSYRYDWAFDAGGSPVENPAHDDLLTANDSGAIIVLDANHIRAFTRTNVNVGRYRDYQRFTFGADSSRSPVWAPDFHGRWTVHGFDGQNEVFSGELALLGGDSPGTGRYGFESADGDWSAVCEIAAPGDGACRFDQASTGARLEFPLSGFQGNLARGTLRDADSGVHEGFLVRHPFTLPLLDRQ